MVHSALKVASLEPFRRALAAHHLQPVGGPRIRADGVEQIYLADPDGYVVERCASTTRRRLTAEGSS